MAQRVDCTRHNDIRNALAQYEYTCKECGKIFYTPDSQSWVYRIVNSTKTLWFCSHRCWRNNGGDGGNAEYLRRCNSGKIKPRKPKTKVIGRRVKGE